MTAPVFSDKGEAPSLFRFLEFSAFAAHLSRTSIFTFGLLNLLGKDATPKVL
jgi:hypothetical protein